MEFIGSLLLLLGMLWKQKMPNRIDPLPDPYIRKPNNNVREPSRTGTSATIGSTRPQQRMRAVAIRSTTPKTIANVTFTPIDFDSEQFDNAGLHDPVTNNTRLTIPSTGLITGTWLLHGKVVWQADAGGARLFRLIENAATILSVVTIPASTVANPCQDVWKYVDDPIAGTYYTLEVWQSSGANTTIATAATETYFELMHIW